MNRQTFLGGVTGLELEYHQKHYEYLLQEKSMVAIHKAMRATEVTRLHEAS